MIPANELRIGNWVLFNDNPCQIEAIRNSDKANVLVGGMSIHRTIYPISLTPETLEKCGLSNDGDNEWFDADFRHFHYTEFGVDYISDSKTIVKNVKYLHQLQNLYFALTQTELKINL